MLVFKKEGFHTIASLGYILMLNMVTTGQIDHKISTELIIVDFDAILSIASFLADAE